MKKLPNVKLYNFHSSTDSQDDQIKKADMGRECNTRGRDEKLIYLNLKS
jgi:hypothetical protein